MDVQPLFYSDHHQNNNNKTSFSNLNKDFVLMSGSSVFRFGNENKSLCSSYESQLNPGFLDSQKIINFNSDFHNLRTNGLIGFHNLCSELEKQRLEMNGFLHFQNEKLKAVLNEETKKQDLILLQNYESKMKAMIESKDEALNRATNRTKKLQNYLLMAEKEAKIWEKKAIESEAIMTDLNRKLKQAKARTHEDAESICNGDGEKEREKMVCKICHARSTCVLLLPCRHLCCCRHCEDVLIFCPVCKNVKNGSLDVVLV